MGLSALQVPQPGQQPMCPPSAPIGCPASAPDQPPPQVARFQNFGRAQIFLNGPKFFWTLELDEELSNTRLLPHFEYGDGDEEEEEDQRDDSEEDEDRAPGVRRRDMEVRRDCPYLDTVNRQVLQLDKSKQWAQALDGTDYLPGMVGLNNIKKNDFVNATIQSLMRVIPLRDFFLIPENYKHCKSPLVQRFGELTRKIWHPRNFKGQVSLHEFFQAVMVASRKQFRIGEQADPVTFMMWLLNKLHTDLGGTKKSNSSVIYKCFQGELEVVKEIPKKRVLESDEQRMSSVEEENATSAGVEREVSQMPFLMLGLDLPPPPLFKDVMEKNIILQVPLFNILKKFDGETVTEVVRPQLACMRTTKEIVAIVKLCDKYKVGCLLVRPIVSAGSASYIMEQQAPTTGGEVPPVAEPVVRDTPTMHSVTILDRQRRVSHKFSVPETAPENDTRRRAAVKAMQDLYETVMHDFLSVQELREKFESWTLLAQAKNDGRLFANLNWPTSPEEKEAVTRLNLLLTIKESSANIPHNLKARRRLEFFTNSLFMHMPVAPPVRKMLSFSVFAPYYEEDVMYSKQQLVKENEDGISILFYLQKIFPDEWRNFLERVELTENRMGRQLENEKLDMIELHLWASFRGQTLAQTVRCLQ
ncbi:unnamed protein product [Calypogeia fissa]